MGYISESEKPTGPKYPSNQTTRQDGVGVVVKLLKIDFHGLDWGISDK